LCDESAVFALLKCALALLRPPCFQVNPAPPAAPSVTPETPAIPVLAIVGVGLIGGSFAAALRRAGYVGRVLGVGRSAATLAQAKTRGLIDEAVSLQDAAARADLILLATPIGAMGAALAAMRDALSPHAIVTDAGSTKQAVIAAARAALGERIQQFVPGHPIAGSDATGPGAADAALYAGRNVVLTPLPENDAASVDAVTRAWQACGARVQNMTPAQHDAALASVSHLPHWLAAFYMLQVSQSDDALQRLALAGTGFAGFTRIAAGSPEIWRDIFLSNREAMLTELQALRAVFAQAETALQDGSGEQLYDMLAQATRARRDWRGGDKSGHESGNES